MNDSNKPQRPTGYETPVKIDGDFLEVFKVVKKNKEQNSKAPKKRTIRKKKSE